MLDEDGKVTGHILGTDTYAWLPDGHWVVHQVDVRVDQPTHSTASDGDQGRRGLASSPSAEARGRLKA